ncbi:U15-lycotoxin-Ls1d-like [Argiope bruennichi]|uniref:Secretory peptide n=1 Tax=Argiope bruennichi TaxID=94029 RepID=A0A8T0E4L0_ARGBR|nr:U15-lycotoxin-Ls1d-like [Argiope bruennichi]KAF8764390.1 hypothetical protein HNY73_022466 [Argiope bruennichi]
MKLLLVFLFTAVVGNELLTRRVCPPNPLLDCSAMRSMDCCSSSDCIGGYVCCLGACKTYCRAPIVSGRWGLNTEYQVSHEECSELKEGIVGRYTGRN